MGGVNEFQHLSSESANIRDHKHLFIEPSGRRKVLEFNNTPIVVGVLEMSSLC